MTKIQKQISMKMFLLVDWFIPASLKADGDTLQGVRMFLFSHLFGPFLGNTITLYILYVEGAPNLSWWILFGAITAFWVFPFLLRATGWYVVLAFVSIQNLIFCILWGCYQYGGVNSPILPWMVTIPLLAFFYLPRRGTRIIVSVQIVINLAAFYLIYQQYGFADRIPLSDLTGLGILSTFCAGLYVSMMALYYGNVVSSQSELEREIQNHLATTQLLREQTEKAERATTAKSVFLAKMSHELRTPLNAIIGYSDMLIDEAGDSNDRILDVQKINDAGKRLLELINDLLELSRLDARKAEVYVEEITLASLVDEIAAESRAKIIVSGNDFVVECQADNETIVSDVSKLKRAVGNLLKNAAKFTRNGTVTLSATCKDNEVSISVRDTGIGISAERMDNLYETFSSREYETSSKYDEHPRLGLPISRRLCLLLHGSLTVDSEVGKGSCFTVRLPSRVTAETIAQEVNEAVSALDAENMDLTKVALAAG